jgi:hypothetical protein
MARQTLDKLVATQLLEAVRSAQAHLSKLKMESVELGTAHPKELVPTYGRIRRLRDYLQRAVAAYPTTVDLELSDEDCDVLCSCIVLELGVVDEILERDPAERERSWLEEKAKNLTTWIVRLATRPVEELPRRPGGLSNRMRDAMVLVRKKVLAENKDGPTIFFAGGLQAAGHPTEELARSNPQEQDPPSERASAPGPSLSMVPAVEVAGAAEADAICDPNKVRDPRLRTMMTLDQRAYARAMEAEDFRLAAIHLASMLESAVFDHTLPRIKELGLNGAPDTWTLESLVTLLIEDFAARDRAMLLHLIGTRNLIRPGTQLREPVVVTRGILSEMRLFVRRLLATLGFVGNTPAPAA